MPAPGRHGGDGTRVARALGLDPASVLDLSASVNPCGPDVAAMARRHLDALAHYPDATPATDALAGALGVDAERVVLTNGGAEAISLVAAELGGGVAAEPEFALHPRGDSGPRWRSDPHNPTGRLAAHEEWADVRDEAFYPLATGRWSRRDPAAVVVGSLTKLFACPGLRAGYVVAPDADLAGRLRRRQPAWSVNALAAALVPDLLAVADLAAWASQIAGLRRELVGVLSRHHLPPLPSDANWVLVPGAAGLRSALALHGIVVRDCASFGLLGHVRVAVPGAAGLERLDRALTELRR